MSMILSTLRPDIRVVRTKNKMHHFSNTILPLLFVRLNQSSHHELCENPNPLEE
ncbi:uncharacterized protein PHALS_07559 [Plasmopara halstedii]|uniref:Uncharacterized protein n=1 Tax=Plasmopara halstedii TaxID=4781 RepID=A0A0P1B4V7_PLAHL|nr:uncharacterized protein PHALS_07559 [Plasmopara halstedii]CEG49817.1 hypothetical protein PHALS_07559 [Plasmopara halstedii]|eukprot:XP_024586186.1 hypothetical protein PHALS_07559 [Plasmopara halstedii]